MKGSALDSMLTAKRIVSHQRVSELDRALDDQIRGEHQLARTLARNSDMLSRAFNRYHD
jgi:hypothetical protein